MKDKKKASKKNVKQHSQIVDNPKGSFSISKVHITDQDDGDSRQLHGLGRNQ